MLFAVLALHANNRLENVFVSHILLEIQIICACHVRTFKIEYSQYFFQLFHTNELHFYFIQRLQIQFVNRNVVKMRIVAMDSSRMNVSVIRIRSETHTKFADQLRETHARIQNVESERNVVKQMVASNVFARSVTPAIHSCNVVTWMNVWRIRAERIRFVSTLPAVTTANVNVDFSGIRLQCVVPCKKISNVMIQSVVLAA